MKHIYSITSGLMLVAGMFFSINDDWKRAASLLLAAIVVQLYAMEERMKDSA
ncbi:hypothetical protein [Paraburkholderia caledonica]|uniref:Uncharacterized protein n=1 Tax=Paraburkholderia caledonica TaxID=134536 RepID=A0AB73I7Y4_9BURK|nr:hypothetical protein [Paraburkholderia caledonica]